MEDARVREVTDDAVRIDADRGRVTDVEHVVAHRVMVVLPRVENRAEKGLDRLAAIMRRFSHQLDEARNAVRFDKNQIRVLELGTGLLAQKRLQFLVDHLLVDFDRRQAFGKLGVAILHALDRGQEIVEVPVSQLRLEGIDEHLRMTVEVPVHDIAAMLEASRYHNEIELCHPIPPRSIACSLRRGFARAERER